MFFGDFLGESVLKSPKCPKSLRVGEGGRGLEREGTGGNGWERSGMGGNGREWVGMGEDRRERTGFVCFQVTDHHHQHQEIEKQSMIQVSWLQEVKLQTSEGWK